jgi:hypothetical protein
LEFREFVAEPICGLFLHEHPLAAEGTMVTDIEVATELARRRKISVKAAAQLNDLSEDTFRRRYPHLIKQVSPRRQAVELSDALAIGDSSAA